MEDAATGAHDASDGSVPFFTAWNQKGHVIRGFFDSSSIVSPEQIPGLVDLLKDHPMTPTSRIVASGMVEGEGGGQTWGMVESDDRKAPKPHTEHVIILLTSTDNSLLRVMIGGPHADAAELVKEANEVLVKFERHGESKKPNFEGSVSPERETGPRLNKP